MVRTQLYLPEKAYKYLKESAKKQNISFAGYVRILIEKDEISKKKKMTIQERFPFIGMFKWGKNAADNDKIDEFLMDEAYGK